MNKKIIAVGGLKDSGKTTAAKMIGYMLNAPKCFCSYTWYKIFKGRALKNSWEITAFANPLKKCLSILLNKPLDWFEDRNNKENYFISLNTLELFSRNELHDDMILSENKFQKLIKSDIPISNSYLLSIRQLMQYFGTNVVRKYIGDKTWINSTLNKSKSKNIVISDLRFKVEMNEIKSLYGKTIYINRDSAVPGSHPSEKEVLELLSENQFDYVVNNNNTLEELFNNLKKIIIQ